MKICIKFEYIIMQILEILWRAIKATNAKYTANFLYGF